MSSKYIMFLGFCWIGCTFVALAIEGSFFNTEELNTINALTGYSTLDMGGVWGIPKLAIGFFTTGFPKLIMWDYSFFTGNYEIIRWFLIATLSLGAVWGMISLFVSILQRAL